MTTDFAETPTISIATPSYNQGEFLAETIESVLGQDGDFYIDYVIMDGGSTDDSVEIIRHYDGLLQRGEWPKKCEGIRFRWVSGKDKGQADALTKGFRMAEGDILAWLNSDDTYLPGALQAAADHFRDHPETGLLYGESHYCDTAGAIIGRYRTEEYDFAKLAWFNFICQPSTFFTREAYAAVGGLDETLQFAMDYDLWIRIGKLYPSRYLPRYLSTYRLHEGSKTIRDDTLLKNSEEGLRVAMRHFEWAPLTRVHATCSFICKTHLPRFMSRSKFFLNAATILCSVFRSVRLNRGFHRNDLRLLNRANFAKLFKTRMEIMTGTRDQ
jgi:glycosyltransferase involved in cell wall biosynthesis